MSDKCPYEKMIDGKYRDIFCTNCWRHERFFRDGHSWSPDLCACGCQDTTVWYKMGPIQRMKAKKKYKEALRILKEARRFWNS